MPRCAWPTAWTLGSGLEAAAVVGLESFQASLASGQRQTAPRAGRTRRTGPDLRLPVRLRQRKAAAGRSRTEEEASTPSCRGERGGPPAGRRRAAAAQPEVGPDDFQFGANPGARAEPQPDAAAPDAAQDEPAPFAAAGGWAPERGPSAYADQHRGVDERRRRRAATIPRPSLRRPPTIRQAPASYGYPAAGGQPDEPEPTARRPTARPPTARRPTARRPTARRPTARVRWRAGLRRAGLRRAGLRRGATARRPTARHGSGIRRQDGDDAGIRGVLRVRRLRGVGAGSVRDGLPGLRPELCGGRQPGCHARRGGPARAPARLGPCDGRLGGVPALAGDAPLGGAGHALRSRTSSTSTTCSRSSWPPASAAARARTD